MRTLFAAILGTLALLGTPAEAHKESDAYLELVLAADAVTGRLDLHLGDLDHALGLDTDAGGTVTWGEVLAAEPRIRAFASGGVTLAGREGPCTPRLGPLAIAERSDGAYAVLPISAPCPGVAEGISVGYDLFFQIDRRHRARVAVRSETGTRLGTLGPETREARFGPDRRHGVFAEFFREGVVHLLEGADHMLFLLTLVLGAVGRGSRPRIMPLLATVTAFTVGHSVTLALAAGGLVLLPPRLVEAGIALSIVLGAANLVWPVLGHRVWLFALGFGLVHGFGFANVLAELDLPAAAFALALLAFNLGVEAGQVGVVLALLPLVRLAAGARSRPALRPALSVALAGIGLVWFVERSLGVALLPVG